MSCNRIDASPETIHWGYFDAGLKPVVTINSGDTVTMSTVSGGLDVMPAPDSGFVVPPALSAIQTQVTTRFPFHICTGPVGVRGARAGQVLEVNIERIDLHYDWGYNVIRPLAGALPDDFHERRLMHIPLDAAKMEARLPWA